MNRSEIMKLLPHRNDMLLLDDGQKEGEEAVAHYLVRGDEFFLRGHFPGNPVVPGVILCEIMAQSACLLMEDGIKEGQTPLYTGMNNVRFRLPVKPGDRVEARCRIKRVLKPFYFCEGSISVDGKICASSEFSFALATL